MASRAEALAVATNALRTAPGQFLDRSGQLIDREAVRNAPPGALREISKDETGDWRIRLSDALQAARLILDDAARRRGDEDPMAGPRRVVNLIMVHGTPQDRAAFDAVSRRMAETAQNERNAGREP